MGEKILCVDDDANMRSAFALLENNALLASQGLRIETAESGSEALAAIGGRGPFAVVLADLFMPDIDGIQLLSRIRELAPHTVRLMITGFADLQVVINAINEGNVFRFLTKPCMPSDIAKAILAGLEQHRLLLAEKGLLENTVAGTIKVLTDVLSLANPTAFGRAARVQRLVRRLATALKVEPLWQLEVAALLSQLGCIAVPEEVLRKVRRGAKLSQEEERVVLDHPRIGHDLIAAIPRLGAVADIIAYQNKRFDGSGAPFDDKRGPRIPFGARVLKLALDFDELEAKGMKRPEAVERLRGRPGWYDPTILDALSKLFISDRPEEMRAVRVRDICEQRDKLKGGPARPNTPAGSLVTPVANMVLADDVLSEDSTLLLSKGQELTDQLIDRLRDLSQRMRIREPIKVLMPATR